MDAAQCHAVTVVHVDSKCCSILVSNAPSCCAAQDVAQAFENQIGHVSGQETLSNGSLLISFSDPEYARKAQAMFNGGALDSDEQFKLRISVYEPKRTEVSIINAISGAE